jgi:hypothetical protein
MEEKIISRQEQSCIADCIFKYWGQQSETPPEDRENSYEECLGDCRICS